MVGVLEPMRRRLVEVPIGPRPPVLDRRPELRPRLPHPAHRAWPRPGDADQLAEQVARIVGRPMDRTRPLWEVYVIEGLEDGRGPCSTKYHHATIDGASGVELMIDDAQRRLDPDAPPPGEPAVGAGAASPAIAELLRLAIANMLRNPVEGAAAAAAHRARRRRRRRRTRRQLGARRAGRVRRSASSAHRRDDDGHASRLPASTGAADAVEQGDHRRTAASPCARRPLEDIKRIKDATGGTVNDVVMAICAGALRALPDRPRRAARPPAAGDGAGVDPHRRGGRPVDQPRVRAGRRPARPTSADPLERVAPCHEAMDAAKRAVRAGAGRGARRHQPVLVAGRWPPRRSGWPRGCALADRVNPPVNVMISNVPGPRQPLYLAGARARALHPGVDDRRGAGPEHHRAQLPRRARLRPRRRAASWCPTCGT